MILPLIFRKDLNATSMAGSAPGLAVAWTSGSAALTTLTRHYSYWCWTQAMGEWSWLSIVIPLPPFPAFSTKYLQPNTITPSVFVSNQSFTTTQGHQRQLWKGPMPHDCTKHITKSRRCRCGNCWWRGRRSWCWRHTALRAGKYICKTM